MQQWFLLFVIMLMTPLLAFAQTGTQRRGWGYGFLGPGAAVNGDASAIMQVGGGGEGLLTGGLGLGGEIGWMARTRSVDNGFGLASINLSYHFARSQRFVPFLTGGGSLAFRSGSSGGGGNFGAGIHYWFHDRAGLRLEVRDHILSSDTPQFISFRIGIAFR